MSRNITPRHGEPVRVNLEDGQLTVKLTPPKAPKRKKIKISGFRLYLLIFLICISTVYTFILMLYVVPNNVTEVQRVPPDLGIAYKVPIYLSVGDENIVEVSVINMNLAESFTGTITLKFNNSIIPITAISDQGVSIFVDNLIPGGRFTKVIRIKLSKRPAEEVVFYYFQISQPEKDQLVSIYDIGRSHSRSQYDKFFIAPISYLRSSLAWGLSAIGGTGVLGLLVNYLIEKFKQYFGL